MTGQPDKQCPNRESRYVPWSFGEVYECTDCGWRERQSHQLKPLPGQGPRINYDTLYPMPEHPRRDPKRAKLVGGSR